jgi:hypothetical protein
MGDSDVIKSFLVGLGFDVDQSSLSAFNKAIQTAALRVTALYTSVSAFAGSMVYAFSKISEGFEEMGYQYHIIAPAINKAIVLRNELMKAYSAAGINIRKVIVDSVNLNMSLTKTKYAMEAIYKSVGSKFFGLLQAQSDAFRKRLYQNMPYIINALEKLIKVVFYAFDTIVQLGERIGSILGRVYDFFVSLDKATDGWSTIILGVLAAWKLLNLEFLATPLGMLLAGFLAILALYDDFKTFTEGGKSLINWGPYIPVINAVSDALGAVFQMLYGVVNLAADFFTGKGWGQLSTDIGLIVNEFKDLGASISKIFDIIVGGSSTLKGLLDFRDRADNAIADTAKSALNWFTGGGSSKPLGSNTSNNNSSAVLQQQTNINVNGTPNAAATGQVVAAQQSGVNRDAVRNLKGAVGLGTVLK